MSDAYDVIDRLPTLEEYRTICRAVGWEDYINFDVAAESIENSLFGVVIEHNMRVIGMGRVVGDGRIYFYIQDIAVLPDYQSQGVGGRIMDRLVDILEVRAPEKAFIGLFAANGKEPFYRKYKLNNHDGLEGMFGVKHNGKIV
jgi:ribosomal protein S18 acetylase RimI-like enzyme